MFIICIKSYHALKRQFDGTTKKIFETKQINNWTSDYLYLRKEIDDFYYYHFIISILFCCCLPKLCTASDQFEQYVNLFDFHAQITNGVTVMIIKQMLSCHLLYELFTQKLKKAKFITFYTNC